jgi:hypothetical protein
MATVLFALRGRRRSPLPELDIDRILRLVFGIGIECLIRTSKPLSITSMLPRLGVGGSQASTATYFVPSVSYAIRGHSRSVISDAALPNRQPGNLYPCPLTSQAIPMVAERRSRAPQCCTQSLVKGDKRSELYTVLKVCPPALAAMANYVPSSVFGLTLVAWLRFLLT